MAKGAGTHAAAIFKKIFGDGPAGGCGGCQSLLDEMDREGPAWCRSHMRKIVSKIRQNAKKFPNWRARMLARMPGVQAPIWALVLVAVTRAESELQEERNHGKAPTPDG